jgi:arylsulfatase A-like enzyme
MTRMRALGLLALTAALGCADASAPPGRGVLVVAVDALRYDHLGYAGYDRPTSPAIDALAADGIAFEHAFTAGPELFSAHTSLLTGCDPLVGQRPRRPGDPKVEWFIPDSVPSLARELLAHGYRTAAFFDHDWISSVYGFGTGFEDFYSFWQTQDDALLGFEGVGSRFKRWLQGLDLDEDWFAYVHVNDLERVWTRRDPQWDTYFEPRAWMSDVPPVGEAEKLFFAIPRSKWSGATQSLGEYEAEYDGAVCALDLKLSRLVGLLQKMGRYETTTLVLVGTFGVGFGESGLILDNGTLSCVDLRVPLVIRPGAGIDAPRAHVYGATASLLDLAPTLLELSGIEPPAGMHGVSHAASLRGRAEPPREHAFAAGGIQQGFAVLDARHCFERAAPGPHSHASLRSSWFGDDGEHLGDVREYLHDRATDPGPGHLRVSADAPEVSARMRDAGQDWYSWMMRAREALHRVSWDRASLDPAEVEALRERGLVGF